MRERRTAYGFCSKTEGFLHVNDGRFDRHAQLTGILQPRAITYIARCAAQPRPLREWGSEAATQPRPVV